MTDQLERAHAAGTLARLTSAAAAGIAFGVLTLWLQGELPGNWNVLANSGAVWTVVAVGAAALLGASRAVSAAAGLLTLVGEVAGFYWCAAPWKGIPVSHGEQLLWTAAALVIGPVAGLTGQAVARGRAAQRVVGLLAIAGLVVGEGWYEYRYIPDHRAAAAVEIGLGLLVAVVALLASRAPWHRRAGAAALGTVVAAAVLLVYANPVLL